MSYNRITTITGAASDTTLVSLATLKTALAITTPSDAVLTAAIADASAMIQSYCNRMFISQQYTDVVRFQPGYIGIDSGRVLQLGFWPVIAMVSVTWDTTVLTAPEYDLDGGVGQLRYLQNDEYTTWIAKKITSVYTAGYSPVPKDVQRACIELAYGLATVGGRDSSIRKETIPGVYDVWYQDNTQFTALGMSLDNVNALDGYIVSVL